MKTNPSASAGILDRVAATPGSAPGLKVDHLIPAELSPAHNWAHAVAFDHSRVLLPHFAFASGDDPLSQIYRLSLDEGEPRANAGAFTLFWARLVFALVAFRQAWIYFRRYGSFVRKTFGISRRSQFADLWHVAWRHNQSPRHYYWRKLYLIPDRRDWLRNLEHRQVNTLLNHLNRRLPITKATDKVNFNQHCVVHGLPTAPMIATWDKQGLLVGNPPAPVAADLFLKPTSEFGSVGIMPVVYQPATATHRLRDADLAWDDLLRAIGDLARTDRRPMILQRRLFNAERNSIYGEADICNVRLITGLAPGENPVPIGGFVRLPSSMTTTGHDRNIMISSIDVASGRMESGRFRETMLGDFPVHPDTGAPIANRIFPGWKEMIDLTVRAHRTYPWIPFIGWDVIDSPEGIILLEANTYWGGDCVQLPGAAPLGDTAFAEIYLKCFEYFYGPDTPACRRPIR